VVRFAVVFEVQLALASWSYEGNEWSQMPNEEKLENISLVTDRLQRLSLR
jgi:hypothetical protein